MADPATQLWHLQDSWLGWAGPFPVMNVAMFFPFWLSWMMHHFKNALLNVAPFRRSLGGNRDSQDTEPFC